MARRTSRRPKVVWLPLDINNRIQTAGPAIDGANNGAFQFGVTTPSGGGVGGTGIQVVPIVKDEPQNITGITETLSDLEGSAYRLRRIVGKIFVQPAQIGGALDPDQSTSFLVTAGFIILRVDANGAVLAGSATPYDVQALDSARDPWIWRRSWMVSNLEGIIAINAAAPNTKQLVFPTSNVQGYGGGVADGPHIDAKTARVVADEERLFLVVSAVGADGSFTQGADTLIAIFGEVRVLASMRSQSGNRRNASR